MSMRITTMAPTIGLVGILVMAGGPAGPAGLAGQERAAPRTEERAAPEAEERAAPEVGVSAEAVGFRWTWTLRPTLTQRLAASAGLMGPGDLPGRAQPPRDGAGRDGREEGRADGAVPTRITVRAVAHDAKVIGSGVGGARITIRDVATGEVLAEGVQEGSTGDTRAIMMEPRPRGLTAYGTDPEAAGFTATLELERPTRVEVSAEGPLGTPHAVQRSARTLLLVPGHDIVGEGVILVLNGFTVELLEAERAAGGEVRVRARVTMLCGCPTEPGGMWDADRIDVVARVLERGGIVAEAPLSFSGETSIYEGTLEAAGSTVEVLAADPERANFGIVRGEIGATR